MDICSSLYFVTWTGMSLLCVFSYEVTVMNFDLKPCEDNDKVCVTESRDCGPRPPSSIQKTLNMSCYYQRSESMTCELSQESNNVMASDIALIFTSRNKIFSCRAIFSRMATLNVTARMKDYEMGTEIRSQPHTVILDKAVKLPQPEVTVLGSTDDSITVSWRSSSSGSCRLRYRVNDTQTWSQSPDLVHVTHEVQTLVHRIKGLLPFTVYRAAVSCRGRESDIWSHWSPEVTVRTQCRAPSRPPEVCYRVERPDPGGSVLLHLMWKGMDLHEAGGRILGYQVSYDSENRQNLHDKLMQNITAVTALLVLREKNYNVTVTAFNMAGYGPAAELSIDTRTQSNLPSVRNLWVSSSFPAVEGLLVQWESPTETLSSSPPVNHFVVQWHTEHPPSTIHWSTVDGLTTSTVIQDLDPDETYVVSVVPVHRQLCGPPQSLLTSLQQGALMEAVKLQVVKVMKTQVTVAWAWQRKSRPVKVNRYTVMLKERSEKQNAVGVVSLWPDQLQHTFLNLKPDTEYSLFLLADNASRNTIAVRTDFDKLPVVAAATPVLLFAVTVLVICILSRTVYKSYFFPYISSPWGSATGQWLMDPNQQKYAERNIMDMKDFQMTEKSIIVVRSNSMRSSDKDQHEETSMLPPSHLVIKLSALNLDTDYVSDLARTIDQHHEYAVNLHHSDQGFTCEADAALMHQILEASHQFPQKEEMTRQLDLTQMSHQTTICPLHKFLPQADSSCVNQVTCEADYLVNLSSLVKSEAETAAGQTETSYMICDHGYIANSCFTALSADEDTLSSSITVSV